MFDIQYKKVKPSLKTVAKHGFLPYNQSDDNLDDDTCSPADNDYNNEYRLKCGTVIKRRCKPKY